MGGAEVATAIIMVIEMPKLAGPDEFAAAAAGDLAAGDERLELATPGGVCVAVATGMAAQLLLLCQTRFSASTALA